MTCCRHYCATAISHHRLQFLTNRRRCCSKLRKRFETFLCCLICFLFFCLYSLLCIWIICFLWCTFTCFFCCIINRTFNQMDIFCCLLVIIFGGREYSLGMQILQLFMNCSQPCGRGLKHGHLSYIMCLRLPLVSYTRSAVACQELWVIVHIFIYRL